MPNIDPHRMTDPADITRFITSGKAYFTLRSAKTGTRLTYRVRASDDQRVHFVGVLNGSDNDTQYAYVGVLKGGRFSTTAKSKFDPSSPQMLARSPGPTGPCPTGRCPTSSSSGTRGSAPAAVVD